MSNRSFNTESLKLLAWEDLGLGLGLLFLLRLAPRRRGFSWEALLLGVVTSLTLLLPRWLSLVEATVLHPSSENTDGSKLAEVSKTDEASEDLLPLADDLRDDFPLAEVNELSVLVLAVEED